MFESAQPPEPGSDNRATLEKFTPPSVDVHIATSADAGCGQPIGPSVFRATATIATIGLVGDHETSVDQVSPTQ